MARMYGKGDQPVPGYRLMQFLGRGGIGEVWKASAPGGTECAIKIINLGEKQGLKEYRAIRLVKRIHHPYLVPIMALWLKDEEGNLLGDSSDSGSVALKGEEAELIIAMGIGEKNLADRLQECKSAGQPGIPVDELLGYLEEAAKAIDFLNQPRHNLGSGPVAIQHCDIKPQNIVIVGGSAQVCDFGLARQLNDARKTSMAAGTYAYIAPESIESKSSKTNDQYSLAISYIELRTGYLPFAANTFYDVMISHLQGKLDYSRLPEVERPALRRATAKNPEERFPSCLDFARALRRAIRGGPSSKSEVMEAASTAPKPPSEPVRHRSAETPASGTPRVRPAGSVEFDPHVTREPEHVAPLSPVTQSPQETTSQRPGGRDPTPIPSAGRSPPSGEVPRGSVYRPTRSEGSSVSAHRRGWRDTTPTTTKRPGLLARLRAWFFGS
jgi:serine/threonine protein kinase